MTYCLDTNTLIHAWRFWYTRQTHPTLWAAFVEMALAGELTVPLQVYEELGEREDELFAWCKEHRDALVFEPNERTETQYRRLANSYKEVTGVLGLGQDYADLYVVAVAMETGAIVVTNEDVGFMADANRRTRHRKNYKITNVCWEEEVEFIRVYQILQREEWAFRHGQ